MMLLLMVTASCVSARGLTCYGLNKEVITWLLSQVCIYREVTGRTSDCLRIATYAIHAISLLKMVNSDINYMNLCFGMGTVNSVE